MLCLHNINKNLQSVIVDLCYSIKVGISAQGKSHDLPIYVDREVWVFVISNVISITIVFFTHSHTHAHTHTHAHIHK